MPPRQPHALPYHAGMRALILAGPPSSLRTIIRAGAIVFLLTVAGSAQSQLLSDLRCTPLTRQICSTAGCRPGPPATYAKLSFERSSYSRCDSKGCDAYPARIVRSGAFVTVEVPGRAMLARLDEGNSFVEVVTLGLDTMISHGSCGPEPR